ncbi:4Fe-4S binding protein, partial [bacterium]|nr:4Fe-4S binding protein [candidate division CSSED10-310 bacterium]
MTTVRRLFQIGFLVAAATAGFRHAMGWSLITVETFCPFGGLESMLSLFTNKQFTCATGERNLVLFFALVALTLLCRRVFCSWICPVGTLSEGFFRLFRNTRLHHLPSRRWDRALRFLRIPVLATILYLTYRTGELVFRSVDPYYVLFSFHGHDVMGWSYLIIGIILAGVVLVPMAWCRYLCPLG